MPPWTAQEVRRWQTRFLFCALVLLIGGDSNRALAADKSGRFALKGVAYSSCKDFGDARNRRDVGFGKYAGWLEGYISGYNRFVPDTINIAPWQSTDTLLGLIAVLCKENPNSPYVSTVDKLLAELHPHRLKHSSDIVEVASGSHKATLYREVVRNIQAKLRALGYLTPAPTGIYDAQTSDALKVFQRTIGTEETGFPDQETLFNLFFK